MLAGLTIDHPYDAPTVIRCLKEVPRRCALRVVWDAPGDKPDWEGIKEFIRAVSPHADIWLSLADSTALSSLPPKAMRARAKKAQAEVGYFLSGYEIGNEVNGNWLGQGVAGRVRAAAEELKDRPTLITYYLDGDAPEQMARWAAKHELQSTYAGISWYPNETPKFHPDWKAVIEKLYRTVYCPILIGETGAESEIKPRPSAEAQIKVIEEMYALRPDVECFHGGYYFWSAYQVMKEGGPVWGALKKALGGVP